MSTSQPKTTSGTRSYSGTMSTTTDNWMGKDCPSLGPNNTPENSILSVNFDSSIFNITVPENPSIPGFNNAFAAAEKVFSHFGRGFRGSLSAEDKYGDLRPSDPAACPVYDEIAVLQINGLLSNDFKTLTQSTYTLSAICEDIPVILCSGQISGVLQ